jgi:hypothetical protein
MVTFDYRIVATAAGLNVRMAVVKSAGGGAVPAAARPAAAASAKVAVPVIAPAVAPAALRAARGGDRKCVAGPVS